MTATPPDPQTPEVQVSSPGLRHNTSFVKLFVGETVSGLGTQVSAIALPLTAVLYLRASPFQVGILAALGSVAYLLVGLPSGPYVDRHLKRPILLLCNVGRCGALLSIPVMAALGALTIAQLYAVTFAIGVLSVPFKVAYQSYLPSLVPKQSLVAGSARMQAGSASVDVIGPSLGGILVGILTAPAAVLVDAVSYVISSVAIFAIPATAEPTIPPARNATTAETSSRAYDSSRMTPTYARSR